MKTIARTILLILIPTAAAAGLLTLDQGTGCERQTMPTTEMHATDTTTC